MSAAKCETGWGDSLSTRALLDVERPSPHLAARFARVDPPPPGYEMHTSFREPSATGENASLFNDRRAPDLRQFF